jgi:sugar phosphate isomerase/epimerase
MRVEIVNAAGHPAAGLVIDAWHVFRAGTSLTELSTVLSPRNIFGVDRMTPPNRSSARCSEDTVERRLLSGEGSFDLRGLSRRPARQKGFDGPWGVEILSSSFRQLPVSQAVKLAADSALAVL